MKEVRFMISDAADKLGMEAHVLRYWEEELELEVPRNEMGHRYYTEDWIRTFEQIRLLKQQGYQLKAIKMLIHNQNQHQAETFIMDLEKNLLAFDVLEEKGTADDTSEIMTEGGISSPKTINVMAMKGTNVSAVKMEQFQAMMTTIVRNALAENNQDLGQVVSEQVGERVLKEMNYLMREREEQEEARFRKLDETLRNRQTKNKEKVGNRFGRKRREKKLDKIARQEEQYDKKAVT